MAKPIHMMVRVLDEARSVDFYKKAFGMDIADRVDFPDFTLIYMRGPDAPFEVELTVNKGTTEPYDLGNGYGHVAFVVDDLEAERVRMLVAGLAPKNICLSYPSDAAAALSPPTPLSRALTLHTQPPLHQLY